MSPKITNIDYSYKKDGSDVWVLNINDIPIKKSLVKDTQIVYLAPKSVGGNHKHPRTEWFIGIGKLEFVWLDDLNNIHTEEMNPMGQLKLIEVPPFLPHAVVNKSIDKPGVLYEMADGKQVLVEKIEVKK